PLPEDHGGKGDIASTVCHAGYERVRQADRKKSPSQPRDKTAHDPRAVARYVNVDPGRIGSLRVLADSTDPQAQSRSKEHDLGGNENKQSYINHDVLLEEDRSNKWNVAQQGNVQVRQRVVRGDVANVRKAIEPIDQEDRNSAGKDIDRDPGNDLIRPEADRDHGVNGR